VLSQEAVFPLAWRFPVGQADAQPECSSFAEDLQMRRLLASVVLPLAFGSALGVPPHTRLAEPAAQCETIDLYFFESVEAEGYFDFANWTTADRRFGYLGELSEHHLSMTPGLIEFYVEIYGPGGDTAAQLGEWQYLPGCSRAAVYLKVVGGQPVLRVRVFPPG
jgi:hypothetical protein